MNFKLWITAGDGGDRQEERLRLRVGVLNSELGVRNLKLAGSGWGQLRKVKAKIEAREFITQNCKPLSVRTSALTFPFSSLIQHPIIVARWAHTTVHVHRNRSGLGGRVCFPEAVQANGPATPTPAPLRITV